MELAEFPIAILARMEVLRNLTMIAWSNMLVDNSDDPLGDVDEYRKIMFDKGVRGWKASSSAYKSTGQEHALDELDEFFKALEISVRSMVEERQDKAKANAEPAETEQDA